MMKPLFIRLTLFLLLALFGCAHSVWQAPATDPLPKPAPVALLADADQVNKEDSRILAQDHAWIELGDQSRFILRTLTKGPQCPVAFTDEGSLGLLPRGEPGSKFSRLVCEVKLPRTAAQVKVLGQTLNWKKSPRKIAIIGDTGCRLTAPSSHPGQIQNCQDPDLWPFAKIAASINAWHPDLIVHVGDYHYRESTCPPGQKICEGSVGGDNEESWAQDFFNPAGPLLGSAPWIFVRGNHELCRRGGEGWFHFLDSRPLEKQCRDRTQPLFERWGRQAFTVIDSADEQNINESLKTLASDQQGEGWLFSHRPFLTSELQGKEKVILPVFWSEPGRISSVIAGHRHLFHFQPGKDGLPPEMVTGNGGALLDPRAQGNFGFLTLETHDDMNWKVTDHEVSGTPRQACSLKTSHGQVSQLRCPKMEAK